MESGTRFLYPISRLHLRNPSHLLDFYRFSSWLIEDFVAQQSAIVRAASPGRWVTHNSMRLCDQFDHYQIARHLDFHDLGFLPDRSHRIR